MNVFSLEKKEKKRRFQKIHSTTNESKKLYAKIEDAHEGSGFFKFVSLFLPFPLPHPHLLEHTNRASCTSRLRSQDNQVLVGRRRRGTYRRNGRGDATRTEKNDLDECTRSGTARLRFFSIIFFFYF